MVEKLRHQHRRHVLGDVTALLQAHDVAGGQQLLGSLKARQLGALGDDGAAEGMQPGGVLKEVARLVSQAVAVRLGRGPALTQLRT